jgi:hypothetical protein
MFLIDTVGRLPRPAAAGLALACLTALVPAALPAPARAEPGSLEGSWSGGGAVHLPNGAQERARCRARYSRASRFVYTVNAVCATPSGRVAQVASLQRTGTNSYAGNFYNAEYGVSGSMYVTVRGNTQRVTLTSSAGSASLRLSR